MRILGTLILILFLWASPASAHLARVDIIPPTPTVNDPVVAHAHGFLSDTCWSIDRPVNCHVSPNQLFMGINTFLAEGGGCLSVILNYEETCNFGTFAAGTYTLLVVETSTPTSTPPDSIWVTFTVKDETLLQASSWGTLKSRY